MQPVAGAELRVAVRIGRIVPGRGHIAVAGVVGVVQASEIN
jgi:hypothetical protein